MATRKALKEEFLTCIICHEVFRDPVTLHCGHTLCTQCVTAYTKTQKQAIADGCINCPHCRGTTKIPQPEKPVDEWAGQIKTGFFVQGLVERFTAHSGQDDDEDICSLCKGDGEAKPAVVWCSNCGHALCSNCKRFHGKLHKQHNVTDISEPTAAIQTRTHIKRVFCQEHRNTEIDMYCQDCDKAVCQKCCIEYHRKCDTVIALSKAMANIDKALTYRKAAIAHRVSEANRMLAGIKSEIEKVETFSRKTESEIDFSSDKLIAEIQSQQKQLKEGLRLKKEESLQQLIAVRKTEELRQEADQQHIAFIDHALSSPSDMDHYELYKSTCNIEAGSDATGATQIILRQNFENNFEVLLSSLHKVKLGKIDIEIHRINQRPGIGPNQKPRLSKVIDMMLSSESGMQIEDVIVLASEGVRVVVVSDSFNKCIKSFPAERKAAPQISCLEYDHWPDNLTQISSSQAATTFLNVKMIAFFNGIPKLSKDRAMKTQKRYSGLARLSNSTLAASVTGNKNACIDILDMSGRVLRSFTTELKLHTPFYLTEVGVGDILVSDGGTNTLTRISLEGEVRFCYSSLSDHLGVKSHKGEIFLIASTMSNVIQLTETGKFVRNILTTQDDKDFDSPTSIDIDEDNKMYVSSAGRYIRIYEFI